MSLDQLKYLNEKAPRLPFFRDLDSLLSLGVHLITVCYREVPRVPTYFTLLYYYLLNKLLLSTYFTLFHLPLVQPLEYNRYRKGTTRQASPIVSLNSMLKYCTSQVKGRRLSRSRCLPLLTAPQAACKKSRVKKRLTGTWPL